MKKISIFYMVFVLAFLFTTSCDTSFLDTTPFTEFAEQDVWSDVPLTQAYVNDIYRRLPHSWAWDAQDVDESRSRQEAGFDFNNNLVDSDRPYGNWNGYYASIRNCNVFLENFDNIPDSDELTDGVTTKDRLKGEVLFLRAWYYHLLVKLYGGVPLITTPYELTDDFLIERSSYSDCIQFITTECDAAAAILPVVNTGATGRATKGAALALKSQVLLYAASDSHNNASEFSGFSNPELLGYPSGSQSDRWTAAKNAAKAVMDLGIYSLYKPDPATAEIASKNYENLFTAYETPEDIFVRFYNADLDLGINGWGVSPNGWWGNGGTGALVELTDDFEMSDGSRFSWDNPEQALEPYKNRDPRFYGCILYEGAVWRPRPSDLAGIDPIGVLQVGTWEVWDAAANEKTFVYGLDSRNSVANSWNNNNTGAHGIKKLDRSVDMQASYQDMTTRYFRYAEILLNYAEACNELGEDDEALAAVNIVRKRAFMPDITETGSALRIRLRNERRIELCYEGHRWNDVRRWLIGSEAYHDVYGVKVLYELQPDNTTATIPTITPYMYMTGVWDNRMYFMPISRDEANKNSLLVQNPGY